MSNVTRNEPVFTVATITALVAAVVAAVVAFGVDLSDDEQTAILGLSTVIAPLIVAAFARGKVTPNDNVPPSSNPPPPSGEVV